MTCKICNGFNCTESFHSLKEQQEFEEQFGDYEEKIDELKEKNAKLDKENLLMWNLLTDEQRKEIENELLK